MKTRLASVTMLLFLAAQAAPAFAAPASPATGVLLQQRGQRGGRAATSTSNPAAWTPSSPLAKLVWAAGFSYDPAQDILYSRMDAWQRGFGYAALYDNLAPVGISAIIDCEPIYFSYGGREWMIELWKGQYGLETGGEIGVYRRSLSPTPAEKLRYKTLDTLTGKFFECADDSELLEMSFDLYRKGEKLFSRGPQKHWWLTGFKWGVHSGPEKLAMDVSITFPDTQMRDAFVGGLKQAGYGRVNVKGNSVGFRFDAPKTTQPISKDSCYRAVQKNNAELVSLYNGLGLEGSDPNLIVKASLKSAAAKQAYDELSVFLEKTSPTWLNLVTTQDWSQLHVAANAALKHEIKLELQAMIKWAEDGYAADKHKAWINRTHTLVYWEAQRVAFTALYNIVDNVQPGFALNMLQGAIAMLPPPVVQALQSLVVDSTLLDDLSVRIDPDCAAKGVRVSIDGKFVGQPFPTIQFAVQMDEAQDPLHSVAKGIATALLN